MIKPNPLAQHRRRQRQRGFRRVEVQVPVEDAALLRAVAAALSDPTRAAEARTLLRGRFTVPAQPGVKALIEAAPLEGLDLTRSAEPGRAVEL